MTQLEQQLKASVDYYAEKERQQTVTALHYRGSYDYSALPGHNFSTLKELAKSPLHYQHRLRHARGLTRALEVGTAGHIATLEPERFLREFVLWRAADDEGKTRQRRGKVWDAFKAEHAGKTIIRDDEYDDAIALKDAVRADEVAMRYLGAAGRAEVGLTWIDEASGLPCKGRVDWLAKVDGQPCIVDLKGARDVGSRGFGRAAAAFGYHVQLAFYADGYERVAGQAPRVVIVAVEMTPPHDVVVYVVPDEALDAGRDEYRRYLTTLQECSQSRLWLGQGRGLEQTLVLPKWALPEDEDVSELGLTGWKEKRDGGTETEIF